MTNLIQANAFEMRKRVVQLRREMGAMFLEMGKCLKQIRDEKLYLHMGEGGYDSFYHFLADPEINLNPNTALLYIRVYEFYILKLNLREEDLLGIPINRLNQIKNFLEGKNEDVVAEWIEKARTLARDDFEKEMEENKIIKEKAIIIKKCKVCKKYRIYYKKDAICQCEGGGIIEL